jgi:hypothetical protein
VDPADRLEQAQVRAAEPFFLGDLDQHGGTRVADLVHRMAETGDELLRGPRVPHRRQGKLVVGGVVGRNLTRLREHPGEELAGVLGYPEEPGAAAEQARGERALQRVGRAQVRQPRGDRGRSEAVVGQRHQDRLEDADLGRGGPALGHHPQRQLAESHLAHEVIGQVLAEQGDRVGVRGTERRRVLLRHRHPSASASQARISSPCSSRSGGASG